MSVPESSSAPAESFGAASVRSNHRPSRSTRPDSMHSHRSTSKGSVAIVGGESLLGKELRELLEATDLRAGITLVAAEAVPGSSVISIRREEPEVIASLQATDLNSAKVVLLAAPQEASRKAFDDIHAAAPK